MLQETSRSVQSFLDVPRKEYCPCTKYRVHDSRNVCPSVRSSQILVNVLKAANEVGFGCRLRQPYHQIWSSAARLDVLDDLRSLLQGHFACHVMTSAPYYKTSLFSPRFQPNLLHVAVMAHKGHRHPSMSTSTSVSTTRLPDMASLASWISREL